MASHDLNHSVHKQIRELAKSKEGRMIAPLHFHKQLELRLQFWHEAGFNSFSYNNLLNAH